MGTIEKSVELYERIIRRLEASGNAPYQLKAYKGSLDCIRDCATLEEATAKLAASPWYTAVGQGVMLDDMYARRRAALELGQDDVAAAYEAKMKEVEADYLKAWDVAYQEPIRQMQSAHLREEEKKVADRIKAAEARIEALDNRPAADVSADWEQLKAHKDEIREIGRRERSKLRRGEAVCSAPSDQSGKYSFSEMREEAF